MKTRLREAIVRQFKRPSGLMGRLVGLVRRAIGLLQIGGGDRVLEIGFGPGLAIKLAARLVESGKVVGIDHSEVMLHQAARRNRAAISAHRVQLHLSSADALPSFTEPFDKVMASNVHLFLDDPVSTLRRWLTIMRPGGSIAITHQARKQGATDADTARC